MAGLLKLSRGIDAINEWIGRICAWSVLLATLVSAGNALLRHFRADWSSNSLLELQWYLYGATFMLCAAWTWKNNGHVRIDIISSRLAPRTRNWVEMFCHFFFMLPFLTVLLYVTPHFFWSSYHSGEVSSSVGGLVLWPSKAVILIGVYLLSLQWISEVIKRAAIMRGDLEDTASTGLLAGAQEEAERLLSEIVIEETQVTKGQNPNAERRTPPPADDSAPR